MSRQLKLWNGRGGLLRKHDHCAWNGKRSNQDGHAYICAYSRADAVRLIEQWLGYKPRGADAELRDYFSEGRWGENMKHVTPERGLWIQHYPDGPIRLL